MKKKYYMLYMCLCLIVLPLSAKANIWLGTGFISHKYFMDETEKHNYINNNPIKESTKLNNITLIGPSLDITIFPVSNFPLGIRLSNQILFPVGFNEDQKYRTFHGDIQNITMTSLQYAECFTDKFGLFADLGMEFNYNRIAKENKRNSIERPEYNTFSNWNIFGEIGLLTTITNGYFKLGINYSHSIVNKAYGYDLFLAGGYCF